MLDGRNMLVRKANVMPIECIVRGYLDGIEVDQIGRFEQELLNDMRDNKPEILLSIRDSGDMSDDVEKELATHLEEFSKKFA